MPKLSKLHLSWLPLYLSSCAMGPDYEAPNAPLPEHYYQAPTDGQASLAYSEWQSVYSNSELNELIAEGLARNLDLAKAKLTLQSAYAARTQSRAILFPSVDLTADAEREQASRLANASNGISNEFELNLAFNWELDLWGVNRRTAEAADANVRAAEFDYYGVRISLIASIAQTYFDVLDARNRRAITLATIDAREQALEILKLRKQGGIISGLDVRQAEVALAQAQAKLPAIDQEIHNLENSLHILLGKAPSETDFKSRLAELEAPSALPVGLPSDLLQRRPDIRAADARLHSATAAIGIAKGQLFPKFSLTGAYGRLSPELNNLLQTPGETWSVAGSLLQPVFDSGANLAQLELAKIQQQAALLDYEKQLLVALSEVSSAVQNYQNSTTILASTERLTTASKDYLRLAQLQYGEGVLGYLDVLDAQRQLFDAQLTLSSARKAQLQALIGVYKALGGGWINEQAAQAE